MQVKEAMVADWLGRVLRTYPSQTAGFLADEKDPFRNPIGHRWREALAILLEELLGGMDGERVRSALDSVLQMRAVEDRPSGQSLQFLFELKPILAKFVARGECELLNARVDEMALTGFELFVEYRERTYRARANEAKRRVFVLERRFQPGDPTGWEERS